MAKVKIQGHASGTGILTVTAPNTSTDRTITLPDATGTLLTSAPVTALNNATANELVTVGSTTTELDAESGLTYNGTYLKSSAGSSGVTTHSATRIQIEDDTHCGLEITTPNDKEQYINFSDPEGQSGTICYKHATDLMELNTAGSMRMTKGATVHMNIDSNGIVTKPLQPAFMAIASAQSDMAIDVWTGVTFTNEVFDQNADFTSSTFTAPVTGRYQLNLIVRIDNCDTAPYYTQVRLNTSNRQYNCIKDFDGMSADPSYWNFALTILADMDASDTVSVDFLQAGGSVQADITEQAFFSGHLVC